ncbi:MAG: hypothetical protein AB4368_05440 [Xenococcaceae cyanobacterium]
MQIEAKIPSFRRIPIAILIVSLIGQLPWTRSVRAASEAYCRFSETEILTKEQLLQSSLAKNSQAYQQYKTIIQRHGQLLNQCRSQTWPKIQAIWLRLYPCDISPGSIDYVLDRIVNLGYNQVHLEVLYDSQVLLPPADNPTPWIPVVRSPGAENIDLLEQTIKKGRERGLKVYAWLFTMNFGYNYAQRADRQDSLARNGRGQDSLEVVHDRAQAFIDPYNRQAQIDYYQLVDAVRKRQPDGVLFDYIRYPRGTGHNSLVSHVKDLWIYSPASTQALYERAKNKKAVALIERYLDRGKITPNDLSEIELLYPEEDLPNWQGQTISITDKGLTADILNSQLWFLTVAHAAQGVIDFLTFAAAPIKQDNIPTGAVFFPGGNRLVGKRGFDSRLQAWDKFPASMEWHPMAYAVCNDDTSCITDQIKTVLNLTPPGTKVIPALAGAWGQTYNKHPTLEAQMAALRREIPQIDAVSHFAYSWIEPEIDRQRKFCNLQ